MAINESDLRDLLAADSGDGTGRGVALADVERRVRRIRRRRLAAVTGVLAAGLVVTGVLTVPHTVTAEAPDDIWTAVMAQPEPSPSPTGAFTHIAAGKLVERKYQRAGVKQRFTYRNGKGIPALQIRCPDAPSYVVVWTNRFWVQGQPCGTVEGKRTDGQASDVSRSWAKNGLNTVEVLVIPAHDVPDGLPPRLKNLSMQDLSMKEAGGILAKDLSMNQADAILAKARPYKADWNVTLWDMVPRFS
ncbi:hypothetical protein [Microtetraspora niveoalba]|uniref:hypothetical protein n=1 Tax=Microtetraspora niveoalba TaxID=46175 RepID=UPI00082ACE8B|nr:hypothetical protein [Microtetraspora niveoalba]